MIQVYLRVWREVMGTKERDNEKERETGREGGGDKFEDTLLRTLR